MAIDTTVLDATTAARLAFERDGFVVLPEVLSPEEIERLTQAVDRVASEERGHGGRGPVHLLAFCGREPSFLELLDHPGTFPLVVDILGSNIFMYHCHLDVHPPEDRDVPRPWMWHQDGGVINRDLETSPRPRIAVKLAYFLTDASRPGRGNLSVLPGSHRLDAIERPPGDDNELPGSVPVLAGPGDAVLFDRRLWHMRGANASTLTRKALFYAYTYRWVRARDDLQVRAELAHLVTPVRAQLLGAGATAIERWMPDDVDLPVRDAATRR